MWFKNIHFTCIKEIFYIYLSEVFVCLFESNIIFDNGNQGNVKNSSSERKKTDS